MPQLSGGAVTPETALTFSAVYAAIRVISEDAASLPLEVFKATGAVREIQRDHPAHSLLTESPDGETTDLNLRESQIAHCLGWGSGYSELERDRGGRLLGIHLLHPRDTSAKRRADKSLYYETRGADGITRELSPENVWHIAGLGFNGLEGYSPIRLAREAIGLGKAAEVFGASFFGNSAVPKGALKYPGSLSEDAENKLRDQFYRRHGGVLNAHTLMILQGGLDWVNTQVNPDDAQFLATRQFQVVEIARIFRLPPHKLGDYSQAHLANVEASNLDYLITSLRPWLVRIEKSANLRLFTAAERRAGYYVKHDMRALLRAASKDRAEYYRQLRDLGVYTVDEIRALEDLNPIGEAAGGSARFVPLAMVTLDRAASEPAAPDGQSAATQADGEAPVEDQQKTALNGAQITGLQAIVFAVESGQLNPDSAAGMIAVAFPMLTAEQIAGIIGPAAEAAKSKPAPEPDSMPAAQSSPGASQEAEADSEAPPASRGSWAAAYRKIMG